HFYETFIGAYDRKMKKARGVYYTPQPVISYIVRSIDYLLRERFGKRDGLADKNVYILDPACGTGSFLLEVLRLIRGRIPRAGWSDYVRKYLLHRLFGFELLMAPYIISHLKLGLYLKETGFEFDSRERLGVYLTNTLEPEVGEQERWSFAGAIAEEGWRAQKVKQEEPIMVVLGNPPYSYESANTGEWITSLVRDYYQVDGQPLGERNPRGLQDDYVKFLRFSQWRIEQTGHGIVGMITNHGYLDNPTFRGMRQHLMQAFSEIYVLDLHGNAKKKEVCPDGSKDENVFDIQQGVAIGVFVKTPSPLTPLPKGEENRSLSPRERVGVRE
ncbi:N-6 DNA methylase, partial [bacterium]|nr:N-6 DNA methylase [bacterium]